MFRCSVVLLSSWVLYAASAPDPSLVKARDEQSLPALDAIIAQKKAATAQNSSPEAQYNTALAYSYASEVAMQLHDKKKSGSYAEAGLEAAKKAVASEGNNAEYHRLLGALCGQVIPANPLMGALNYGSCARGEIEKAISLNGNLPLAYLSRGVGNFYLPASMGGGVDLALKDIDKAISIDPKLSDAYMWKGVVLLKAGRNAEARQAFEQTLRLDPDRVWARQQLDKTPAQ